MFENQIIERKLIIIFCEVIHFYVYLPIIRAIYNLEIKTSKPEDFGFTRLDCTVFDNDWSRATPRRWLAYQSQELVKSLEISPDKREAIHEKHFIFIMKPYSLHESKICGYHLRERKRERERDTHKKHTTYTASV